MTPLLEAQACWGALRLKHYTTSYPRVRVCLCVSRLCVSVYLICLCMYCRFMGQACLDFCASSSTPPPRELRQVLHLFFVIMSMLAPLRALLESASLSEVIIARLEKIGFASIADFAMLGDSESCVNKELIETDDLKDLNLKIIEKVRIRSAWGLARKAVASSDAGPVASGADDFAAGTEERLYKVWLDYYKHNPQGSRILAQKLLVKLFKGLQKAPKQLEMLSLVSIRLKSDINVVQLSGPMFAGTSLVQLGSELKECESRAVAFTRMRAYTSSVCFLMAETPDWFSQEDNEGFCDHIFQLIFMRGDNRHPTVKAIENAWLCTLSEFSSQVSLHGLKLGDLVRSKQNWTHF